MESKSDTVEHAWTARPALARLIRITVYAVPILASVACAFTLSSWGSMATTATGAVVRWFGIVLVSTGLLVVVQRLMRRLLPLSTLFTLTLAFPDRVPSRFRIAIRVGTTAQLRRRLDEARRGEVGESPDEVAERLLELVALLSKHDRMTRGHSERVRAYSHIVGEQMGLTGRALDRLRWAALLHDIGKLTVSAEILNKPGRLTDAEFEEIKTHPMAGRTLVAPLAGWLGDSVRAVWEHHERYDGGGYPQGLAGEEISLAARIVCVTDSFDVMTSTRSYKKPMPAADARRELARCAGTQFDPTVVRAFLAVSLGRLETRTGPVSGLAQLAVFPRAIAGQLAGNMAAGAALGLGATAGVVGFAATSNALGQGIQVPADVAVRTDSPAGDSSPDDVARSTSGSGTVPADSGATPPAGGTVPDEPAPVSPPTDVVTAPPSATVPDSSVVTVPGNTVPGVTLPDATVPVVTVPGTTAPAVTVPAVTVPVVTTPATTLPGVTVPGVTVPGVTVPGVTVPGVTVPGVTVPGVTVPTTLPGVTVPTTLPGVTVPTTLPAPTVPVATVVSTTVPPPTVPGVTIQTTLPPPTLPPPTLPPPPDLF